MSFALINKMTTRPGKRQQVMNILLEAGKPFDSNTSCQMYLLSVDKDDPNIIWVQDIWTNREDHEAAMQTEEMAAFIKQAMPLLEGIPVQHEIEIAGGKADLLN